MVDVSMAMRDIGDPGFSSALRQLLQTLPGLREVAQRFQHRVVIQMNNSAAINCFGLFVHHHLVERKRREENSRPGRMV